MPYKQIIWDWNGTLLDDAWLCVAAVNALMRERELSPVTVAHYREHFGWPVEAYYRHLGFELDREGFEAMSHRYIALYEARKHECQLHPETEAALKRVQQAGIDQVILSAYLQRTLGEVIAHYGLSPYFSKWIGNADIFAGSKVDNGRAHLASLPHGAHELLIIGDTLHDHEVAQAIGADCFLVANGHTAKHRLEASGCPTFDNTSALLSYLNL